MTWAWSTLELQSSPQIIQSRFHKIVKNFARKHRTVWILHGTEIQLAHYGRNKLEVQQRTHSFQAQKIVVSKHSNLKLPLILNHWKITDKIMYLINSLSIFQLTKELLFQQLLIQE